MKINNNKQWLDQPTFAPNNGRASNAENDRYNYPPQPEDEASPSGNRFEHNLDNRGLYPTFSQIGREAPKDNVDIDEKKVKKQEAHFLYKAPSSNEFIPPAAAFNEAPSMENKVAVNDKEEAQLEKQQINKEVERLDQEGNKLEQKVSVEQKGEPKKAKEQPRSFIKGLARGLAKFVAGAACVLTVFYGGIAAIIKSAEMDRKRANELMKREYNVDITKFYNAKILKNGGFNLLNSQDGIHTLSCKKLKRTIQNGEWKDIYEEKIVTLVDLENGKVKLQKGWDNLNDMEKMSNLLERCIPSAPGQLRNANNPA